MRTKLKSILFSLLLVAVFALTAPTLAAQNPSTERPNILFIFSDDHAPHAIGAYNGWLKPSIQHRNIDVAGITRDRVQKQLLHEFDLWSQPCCDSDRQAQPQERLHEQWQLV